MIKLVRTWVEKKEFLTLWFILSLSLFFRVYQPLKRFNFNHDSDLFSWIVKDIVVNHHPRLIGQLTSAPGIFIGPLFYYLVAPFMILTKMDPWGAIIPVVLLGVLSTFSYYYVFKKLFSPSAGLIGAFLQAILLSSITFDRWVVPSAPTKLWVIWYFYIIVSLTRGNYQVLPVLGVLIGLIWHIHIALLPSLIAVPVAFAIAHKLPTLKQLFLFFLSLVVTSSPLLLFEIKHNFMQSTSLINNFLINHGGGVGLDKLNIVLLIVVGNILRLFVSPWSLTFLDHKTWVLIIAIFFVVIVYKKIFPVKDFLPLAAWVLGVIFFYTFSSSAISEYYFSNLDVIFIAAVSLFLVYLKRLSKLGKYFVLIFLSVIFLRNLTFFLSEEVYQKGYLTRKVVSSFIAQDAKEKGFPCVAVSYITAPGENMGFRYFFWLNNLHVNQPQSSSPVYTIVIPEELVSDRVKIVFDHIAVLPPEVSGSLQEIEKSCSGENSNLTDPMFGYTE